MKKFIYLLLTLILFIQINISQAQQRFPKPEFENGHTQPKPITPDARAMFWEYFDVLILVVALSIVSYLAIKKRSRRGIFWLSLFSLFYFGFWREGCICPIGSVQNITLALFDSGYTIPFTAVAFFAIPLIFTLFAGRTFCAGVCPLGAIQDVFTLSPIELPRWLQSALSMIPYIYLSLAVLFTATGSDFIICRYDPFVGIFRFDAPFSMYVFGGSLLLIGIFVSRPYCRFLCPYGVLLGWMSKFSKYHLTITPKECIQCRLCETSCPYNAIEYPTAKVKEAKTTGVKRLVWLFVLLPFLIAGTGWLGSQLYVPFSRVNSTVWLAEKIIADQQNPSEAAKKDIDISAFKSMGKSVEQLIQEAKEIRSEFYTGGWIMGGFVGLVFGLTLINLSINRQRTDYVPDKTNCLSCGRCFDYCPVKKE